MQTSPEMINPFKPEPTFDPAEYRRDLLKKVQHAKAEADKEISASKETNEWEIRQQRWERADKIREPLKLAKWDEKYHRARLLTLGNYETGNHGEIIDKNSGLTTQELADSAKLLDNMDYSVEQVLKLLPEFKLSRDTLQSEKMKNAAMHLLWYEHEYGTGITADNSENVKKFVKTFGLEDYLKKIVSEKIDVAVSNSDRKRAEDILKAYPVFEGIEARKRFDSRFYPMPQGLKGRIEAKELFGETLEGPEAEISLNKVVPIFAEKAELLANDLLKNPDFYWLIRQRITRNERFSQNVFGRWVIMRDDKFGGEKGQNYARILYLLGDDHGKPKAYDELRNGPRLEFHFSCSQEDAAKDNKYHDEFTTTKIFHFQGLFMGNERIGRSSLGVDNGTLVRIDGEQVNQPALEDLKAQKVALKELAEELLTPEKDFAASLAKLNELAEKWNVPREDIQDLSKAIKEFGTYMYRKERSDVGDCLSTPSRFSNFCEFKFGIKLKEARYGEYHPEWGNSMGYDPFTFLHQVLVFANRIVMDWTATQFARLADKPIPYIYEIGEERESLGPLYKGYSGKTNPNEQFINDKTDPLFKDEPPIIYDSSY